MVRLHVVVEGQTEETFVRLLLAPSLGELSVFADVHRVTTGRKGPRVYRGGLVSYKHLRRDLTIWMKEDQHPDCWFTTMVDLYRIPTDAPGYEKSHKIQDPVQRVKFLEQQLKSDIGDPRLVPYIQLHEFEAPLFSDPESFSIPFPDNADEVASLVRIRQGAASPEHIDDGAETSPSKRICSLFPQYAKSLHGPIIAQEIGLPRIREACPHFNEWITTLLNLSTQMR